MILHRCNFFLAHVLKMSRTGMTLDFFGFQQIFPCVKVLQFHLTLNSEE